MMINIKRDLCLFAVLALFSTLSQAKVRLPNVMGSNMVLQQNTDVRLWGWADKGKKVVVKTSWSKQKYTCTADAEGRWQVYVRTPEASYKPLSITFDDGEKLALSNILSGEVWACGGQSNMEMPMKGFGNCPVEGYNDEVIDAVKYGGVRFFYAASSRSFSEQDDVKGEWKVVSPETLADCSATAYFFGKTLNRALDVPVGLVIATKGGTPIEAWLSKDNLKAHTNVATDSASVVKKWRNRTWHYPSVWYNATLHPVVNYTVKGMIFYQGCSNIDDYPAKYAERLALFASQCRKDFANDSLPFHYVQIAPYAQGKREGFKSAVIREQQMKALPNIPNATITGTGDLVYPWEADQVHPSQKKAVGERLAMHALDKQYGFKGLRAECPRLKSMTVKDSVCHVSISDTYGGFNRLDGMEGFEVAGDDQVFHKAQAKSKSGSELLVWSDEVKKPVAVRYCFHNFVLGNVANQAGLPLLPFRTDNWKLK